MRGIWWLAAGGGVVVAALVVAGFFVFAGGGGSKATSTDSFGCPPPASTASAGNADVSAQALGKGLERQLVVRLKDKQSGAPLRGATVSVEGTMVCPMVMSVVQKNLHEVSGGTYKGDYNLIMEGDWTINIIARSEQGDATTSALPVRVTGGG
jgi:hypothetical protein